MWKKLLLSALALGFALAANTHLCCSLRVDGQELAGLYAPADTDRARTAAAAAAEEIVAGPAQTPRFQRRYCLSLRPAAGTVPEVSAALLDTTPGVERSEGVYVSGVYLGSVQSREALLSSLRQFIAGQLPTWAESGYLSQELNTRPQYGRTGSQTPVEDMVLLVSGMAPVMYSDGQGHVSSA